MTADARRYWAVPATLLALPFAGAYEATGYIICAVLALVLSLGAFVWGVRAGVFEGPDGDEP
jgi:hypothetical protein